jgi:hypothetical protein
MAGRGKIGLESLTASKEAATVVTSAPPVAVEDDTAPAKRGRGRPPKGAQPASAGKTYGQTIRMTPALRRALRAAADAETEAAGKVISVHDVILEAVKRHLTRKGIEVNG